MYSRIDRIRLDKSFKLAVGVEQIKLLEKKGWILELRMTWWQQISKESIDLIN